MLLNDTNTNNNNSYNNADDIEKILSRIEQNASRNIIAFLYIILVADAANSSSENTHLRSRILRTSVRPPKYPFQKELFAHPYSHTVRFLSSSSCVKCRFFRFFGLNYSFKKNQTIKRKGSDDDNTFDANEEEKTAEFSSPFPFPFRALCCTVVL